MAGFPPLRTYGIKSESGKGALTLVNSEENSSELLANVGNNGERHVPTLDPESKNHYRHLTAYHFVMSFVKDKEVLDYGCGSGYGTNLLWRRGGLKSVLGVDVDARAIEYCKRSYPDLAEHFAVVSTDQRPMPRDEYDIIVLFQTLEHVAEAGALLRHLSGFLRQEGLLFVTTPNVAIEGGDPFHPSNRHHFREYDRNALRTTCREVFAGVEELGIHGSYRVGGLGIGIERSRLCRMLRKAARPLFRRTYTPPVSLSDFTVSS